MNIQQKRACAQRETREGTTRSGASSPTERHCADKAPLRQQGATHKRSKTKSPFCVVHKTCHLDTWILHKTCLKHPKFPQQKTVCPIDTDMEHHGNSNGTGNRRKNKTRQKYELRQGSKHGDYNMPPRLNGRDPELRRSSSNLRIPLHPWHLPHSPKASNLGARANEAIATLNRIAMSGTHVNTRCANKRNKINRENTSRRERNNDMDHRTYINMYSRKLLETEEMKNVSKQSHWIKSRLP